jgi:hypothetical protein
MAGRLLVEYELLFQLYSVASLAFDCRH